MRFCLSPVSSMTEEGYLAQPSREKRTLGKLIGGGDIYIYIF